MKGEHRPNKDNTKRRRKQREAAAAKKLKREQHRAKSAIAAAAEPDQSGLVRRAMNQGWAVPAEEIPEMIAEQIKIAKNPRAKHEAKTAAFNALERADFNQWKRDHPQANVQVNQQFNVQAAQAMPTEEDMQEGLEQLRQFLTQPTEPKPLDLIEGIIEDTGAA